MTSNIMCSCPKDHLKMGLCVFSDGVLVTRWTYRLGLRVGGLGRTGIGRPDVHIVYMCVRVK